MGSLSDKLQAVLAGAPELIDTPGLTVGLARGLMSPLSPATDGYSTGQVAAHAAMHQGAQRAIADFQAIDDGGEH